VNSLSFSPLLRSERDLEASDNIRTAEHELLYIRVCQSIRYMEKRVFSAEPEDDMSPGIRYLMRLRRTQDSLYRLLGLKSDV
jgi:hypothetical protein